VDKMLNIGIREDFPVSCEGKKGILPLQSQNGYEVEK